MTVLLVAELGSEGLTLDATARAVTAVAGLGVVHIACIGAAARPAAQRAAEIQGVAKVLVCDDAAVRHRMAEPVTALLASIAGSYEHIVAPATASAKNIMPRLAALLDVMIVPDVTAIIDAATFSRPFYAGNAIQTVRSIDEKKILTIRTAGFKPSALGGAAPIETIAAADDPHLSQWIEDHMTIGDRPELAGAGIVVSGGRGLGSKEDFAIVERLADRLGAAVGASRAAVDSGYAPNDWQVGQTGKIVAPDLYLAIGISGAIQHLAGMKDSKVIVAINRDADAPIFQIADFGLVADLFVAVPELTAKLGPA